MGVGKVVGGSVLEKNREGKSGEQEKGSPKREANEVHKFFSGLG